MSVFSVDKSWRTVTMNDLAAAVPNAITIGPFGSDLKTTDYAKNGVPVVFVKNVKPNMYTPTGARFVSEDKAEQLAAHKVIPGDLIITKMGLPPCVTAIYPENARDGIVTADIIKLTPNRTCVDARYVSYFLNSASARSQVEAFTNGVTRPKVTLGAFRSMWIPLPSLSEQKRIADILDKADAIRRKRQETVAIVENELLRSAFREQLGDPRTNPKGWPVEQLGKVINFVGGSQPAKETFINEPRPGYVRLVQIRDFKTDKYPTYIPKQLAKRTFGKDDVMIARYGPPVFQILRGLEGSYNVALMKAESTERTTKDFIFHLLQLPEIHDVVVANSQRTAGQSGTNLTLLKGLEIPVPPIELQIQIVAILKSIESYHATVTTYFEEADELFNALVQRAFKGKL